ARNVLARDEARQVGPPCCVYVIPAIGALPLVVYDHRTWVQTLCFERFQPTLVVLLSGSAGSKNAVPGIHLLRDLFAPAAEDRLAPPVLYLPSAMCRHQTPFAQCITITL